MDFILLISVVILFWNFKIVKKDFAKSYLSIKTTTAINGFFVLLVFLRHFRQYITIGKHDKIFDWIDGRTGQLIVTTFLFYSGYGMMHSLLNKKIIIKKLLPNL